jgi:hypothetical protein
MTQRVRTGYRHHRKASWGVVLGLALLIAAIVIPLATATADKNYTMGFPSPATTPPAASGGTSSQSLCTSTTYTVRVQIKNTARTVTLGSANVSFPTGVGNLSGGASFVAGGGQASDSTISQSGNVVSLRGLTLPKNKTVTFSTTLTTVSSIVTATPITAVVKQSNDFNDSGGTANLFDNPTFPTLAVQNCDVTISGQVYHDRDESGSFTTNPTSPATNDIAKSGWTVTLQRNDGGGTYTTVDSDTSDASGNYSVTGQLGRSYRVCVTAPSGDDDGTPWGLRAVAGVTLAADPCTPISSASGSSSSGIGLTSISGNKTGQDFALVPITAVPVGPGDTSGSGSYVVTAAGNSSKLPQQFAQETWTDANGLPYYVFAPINPCSSSCDQLYLLEDLKGTVNQSALSGAQVHLKYDDLAPFTDFAEMPYCLQDPQLGGTDLRTPDVVLPSGASSCIVSATQTAHGDGTAANAQVDFEFLVYTSVDGSRGVT